MRPLPWLAVLALTPLVAPAPPCHTVITPREITVAAGSVDRREAVVSFPLPAPAGGAWYRLRDAEGNEVPVQVDARGQASFVLPALPAGGRKTYTLGLQGGPAPAAVAAVSEGDEVRVAWDGRPVLRYQGGKGVLPAGDVKPQFRRGGYLHTVVTPTGRIVTDDYPPDHRHHHGIWFAWTKTEFEGRKPDFWNMGDQTGTVEFESLGEVWSGPVHGGLRARHRYVDLSAPHPKAVLKEIWETRVYAVGRGSRPYALFDVEVMQEAASASPLVLPEYHYGGLGFRGARAWNGAANAQFLTSEGKDRANGHGTRARWCHISGQVDGKVAGVAILGHPGNFRAPQPMRIHPDEPFFCFAPSQLGRWEIAPGASYLSRYRFVVFDGPADPAELDRLWNDYAQPPEVALK